MSAETPTLLTCYRLARVVGCNRSVINRMVAQEILRPDAWLDNGARRQTLFLPERAIDILRGVLPERHHLKIA
jgi:hypothetical protein